MDCLLRRLDVDPRQFRTLLWSSLVVDFRGHPLAKRGHRSALVSFFFLLLMQGAFSCVLALGAGQSRLALEILSLSYSVTLCATTMLADYSAQLLLPFDAEILAHRPITERTLF